MIWYVRIQYTVIDIFIKMLENMLNWGSWIINNSSRIIYVRVTSILILKSSEKVFLDCYFQIKDRCWNHPLNKDVYFIWILTSDNIHNVSFAIHFQNVGDIMFIQWKCIIHNINNWTP